MINPLRGLTNLAQAFTDNPDPQPGSLQAGLERIDREQAVRAAERLGMTLPTDDQDLGDIPMPSAPLPLPTTNGPIEAPRPAVADPLLLAARRAADAYEVSGQPWTWDGYNAAIIAAALDTIRDSGIENRT